MGDQPGRGSIRPLKYTSLNKLKDNTVENYFKSCKPIIAIHLTLRHSVAGFTRQGM